MKGQFWYQEEEGEEEGKEGPPPRFDSVENTDIEKEMAWDAEHQATGQDGAKHFLKTNEELWTKWVTPDAACKIKNSL